MVLHTLTSISHGCSCVLHPEPPSHLPPHPIPQGHPSALALSTLSHALNLDWQSISHMVIYMFQCYSLRSSHPHLLPQSPKVCSVVCAKPLQSCLTLCNPMDYNPPGSSVHGILQAWILEWVAIAFSNAWKWKVKVKSLSHVRLLATP